MVISLFGQLLLFVSQLAMLGWQTTIHDRFLLVKSLCWLRKLPTLGLSIHTFDSKLIHFGWQHHHFWWLRF